MNRLTRLITSAAGMSFLLTGLFVGIWREVDPAELIQRALLSGLAGLAGGYALGRLFTGILNGLPHKKEATHSSAEQDTFKNEPREDQKLQPWNPPRVGKDEQGR